MKNFTMPPLLDLMLLTLNLKIKISFLVQILLCFLLILSPYDSLNAKNDSWHHKFNILPGFAVILQAFDTPLTPLRTPRISGLKSQFLQPIFLS